MCKSQFACLTALAGFFKFSFSPSFLIWGDGSPARHVCLHLFTLPGDTQHQAESLSSNSEIRYCHAFADMALGLPARACSLQGHSHGIYFLDIAQGYYRVARQCIVNSSRLFSELQLPDGTFQDFERELKVRACRFCAFAANGKGVPYPTCHICVGGKFGRLGANPGLTHSQHLQRGRAVKIQHVSPL